MALNAAVEAARAGQHGKGFGVVAEEVRKLAARSTEASRRTAEIIDDSMRSIKMGTVMASDTAKVFREILEAVDRLAGLAVNIDESSNEQAANVLIINHGIDQVSQIIQKNSALAEQSAEMSENLHEQAGLLADMVSNFGYGKDLHSLMLIPQNNNGF